MLQFPHLEEQYLSVSDLRHDVLHKLLKFMDTELPPPLGAVLVKQVVESQPLVLEVSIQGEKEIRGGRSCVNGLDAFSATVARWNELCDERWPCRNWDVRVKQACLTVNQVTLTAAREHDTIGGAFASARK